MKNFIKITFLMLMTLFIVGCSSDPEVDALVDAMVAEGEGEVSEKQAKCMVNGIKDGATDDQWDMFVGMTLEDEQPEDLEALFTIAGLTMGAAIKCGVELEL